MATPTVAINSGAGSDTLASGAGPAVAVTGVLAATHANTTVNITDAVDLSGVATDGTAALWVASSSGRQWSAISAVSGTSGAWVVTVATAFANTESGRTWAVGGKRATVGSASTRQLFKDVLAGWTVDIQDTQPALTSALVITAPGTAGLPVTVTSTSGSRPTVTTATSSINLLDVSSSNALVVSNLLFTNTALVKGTAGSTGAAITVPTAGCTRLTVDNCSFDGFEHAILGDNVTNFFIEFLAVTRTEIKNSVSDGIRTRDDLLLDHCRLHANGGHGASTASGTGPWRFRGTVFSGNTGSGWRNLTLTTGGGTTGYIDVQGCTFRDNGASGITADFASAPGTSNLSAWAVADNIFYGNTLYGVNLANPNAWQVASNYDNAYGANGTAARHNFPAGAGDVTLTANPFTSPSDSGLNAAAGGGAACKAVAAQAPNASANPPGDVGAVPTGGGASTDPGVANVLAGVAYTINGAALTGTLSAGGGAAVVGSPIIGGAP